MLFARTFARMVRRLERGLRTSVELYGIHDCQLGYRPGDSWTLDHDRSCKSNAPDTSEQASEQQTQVYDHTPN